MAEEINYATVVFKNKTHSRSEAQKEEEIVYDEVKVVQKKAEPAADTNVISVISAENEKLKMMKQLLNSLENNQTTLLEINHNLKDLNNKLSSENERLRRDNDNQTVIIVNLTKEYNVLEMKIKNLTEEIKQLKTLNNLTEQIRKIENCVTQQTFDAYCPIKDGNRQCKPCLEGWLQHQSNCYAIYNPDTAGQKTWEKARDDCRAKNSDLAVIVNEDEKRFISDKSWKTPGLTDYWIGLRYKDRKWKWIDGSDLDKKSWITGPYYNSYCAISVHNQGWRSVWYGNKNGWICKKAALSV
ncbi:C-type lectin domain family 10 member A-like [Scomber japonicus]|uniref:C-type lectin domain family 10 member A-like n=1 Tax=Scomber japonicus TaxID=13676 RepID=UPI002305C8E6|nr:C-type lectin domain family 10 member A-like [Scomber japonicus]